MILTVGPKVSIMYRLHRIFQSIPYSLVAWLKLVYYSLLPQHYQPYPTSSFNIHTNHLVSKSFTHQHVWKETNVQASIQGNNYTI